MNAYTALREALSPRADELQAAGIHVTTQWCADEHCELNPRYLSYLRTAFGCLLDNAFEAVVSRQYRAVRIAATVDNRVLRITFSDTGLGIPREVLPEMFEPFYTTKPGHAGLGLPMCQRALAALGGTVFVASTNAGGAEIVVQLPLDRPPAHGDDALVGAGMSIPHD